MKVSCSPYLLRKPPMGWRPWNSLRGTAYQTTMQDAVDALVVRNRTVRGEPGLVSLCDMGYCTVGVSEGYEVIGPTNRSMHDRDGNPLINRAHFPDMAGLADYANSRNIKLGWYLNSCAYGGPQNDSISNYKYFIK